MSQLRTAPESLFWYWISERHSIYLRRQTGLPKPWSEDPIFQTWKFTNAFRELDKGTAWLRENFLDPHRDDDLTLLAANVCWFRMFNWTGTGALLGWQTRWNPEEAKRILHDAADRGLQVFTGAHIVYSTPGLPKIDAIVDVCSDLWRLRDGLVSAARTHRRLETVFDLLRTVHCVGGFMAYEMVTDMRHTRLLEDAIDIHRWANLGPGAKRGLQRLGLPCKTQAEGVQSMRELLTRSAENLPSEFPALELRDIEHSACEWDKWCRVKFNEGEPRSKFNGRAE